MKRLFLLIIIVLSSILSFGQGVFVDSLGHFRVDNRIITGDIRLNLNDPSTALATSVSISGNDNYFEYLPMTLVTSLTKEDGSPYVSVIEFEQALGSVLTVSQDVNIQDQTTNTIIVPMVQLLGTNTLAIEAIADSYDVTVTSSAGMTIGDHFRIINSDGDRFYQGTILDIQVNVITLDSSIDFEYVAGSEVTYSNINMAVDGSVTPVHFHLRTGQPSIPSQVDITRMIIIAQCSTTVDLNKFGDLPPLTRGLLFRISNGHQRNIFNVKTNAGLAGLAYDFTPYDSSHPTQAVDGFSWRLTFAGQDKIGVALRVESDGQLGLIVQDDLRGLISLFCVLEGHIVE